MTSGGSSMHHGVMPFKGVFSGDRQRPVEDDSCSSSSSIGRNSDEESGDETEMKSLCKGPLDSMDALEEVLPIRKGISNFYNGKSRSFTSLADASSVSSVKDFAKPESLFNRKRKNLLLHRDKNFDLPPRANETGVSRRPPNTSRSTLPSATSCSRMSNMIDDLHSMSSSYPCLPPLHPHAKRSTSNRMCSHTPRQKSPWRCFSLSDLHAAATTASNN